MGSRLKDTSAKQLKPPLSTQGESSADSAGQLQKPAFVWSRKPKLVQINAGRVDVSVPYQVVIAVVLGLVVLILFAFRLGQQQGKAQQVSRHLPKQELKEAKPDIPTPALLRQKPENVTDKQQGSLDIPAGIEKIKMVELRRNHRIVIQQYHVRADLVPVQGFFAENGLDTEIQQRGNRYFLVTKGLFENPQRRGTDGYEMRQRIIRLGAAYRAPEEYETFARHLFSDAYGERVR